MIRKILFILVILSLLSFSNPLFAMPPVQRTVLPNALVLLVSEDHSLPFVTVQLLVNAGSWRDPAGQEGLAYIAARGLLLGASNHTVNEINEELDFMGASLSASASRDYAEVSLRVLKKDLDRGLALFMEALTGPVFPEEEIRREIEKTLAQIQSSEDQPEYVAQKEFQKVLFQGNPYAHPVNGTRESVPRITREAVQGFYRSYYHPSNAILTVVGDITREELKSRLLHRLEAWPAANVPVSGFDVKFEDGRKTVKIDRSITQANIILGHRGVERSNPDYYALSVMNYILGGGGFDSRLVEEVRNRRGFAYSVASYFDPGRYPGSFEILLQTKNASAAEAISIAIEEMKRIRMEPVSEKELDRAKKYLVGSFPMRFNTQAKMANFLSQVEYYGLGKDYPDKYASLIQSVTREEVLRVAEKYLHPDHYVLIIVANLKEAAME
jgi:zinc protease